MSGWITFQSAKLARVDQFSVGVDTYGAKIAGVTASMRVYPRIIPNMRGEAVMAKANKKTNVFCWVSVRCISCVVEVEVVEVA